AHARGPVARRNAAAPVRRARLPSRVQSRLGPDRRITPADLLEAWTVAHQRVHAARVEQLAALPLQPLQGLVEAPGRLVGPAGKQRVENVGHRHEAGLGRYLISLATI